MKKHVVQRRLSFSSAWYNYSEFKKRRKAKKEYDELTNDANLLTGEFRLVEQKVIEGDSNRN